MGLFGTIGGLFTGATEGKLVGGIANGFANAAGTPNSFTATPYGITPASASYGDTGGLPGIAGLLHSMTNMKYTPAQTDPNVAAAFNYQDPNAPAYTQGAQTAQNQGAQAYNQQQGIIGQQGGLAQLLTQSANGQGPSIADLQLNHALDQSRRQASSIQANAISMGVNPAVAAQMASNAMASNSQQAANDSATQKVNEELAGRMQLSQLLSQMGGQNLGQQSLSGGQALNYYGMGQQGAQFGSTAQQNLQGLLSGNYNTAQDINANVATGNASQHAGLVGSLIGGAANIGAKVATGGKAPA